MSPEMIDPRGIGHRKRREENAQRKRYEEMRREVESPEAKRDFRNMGIALLVVVVALMSLGYVVGSCIEAVSR